MGKTNFFFGTQPFSPWAILATTCRSSSKNIGKVNIQPMLNKNSPWAHMETEFDVLGVAKKLVKIVLHLSTRIFIIKNQFLFSQGA
jgi:hypothetical protein